ncbi:hypothetical protein HDV57DRAFT_72106 [Trichoderma longibrachiatum]|uniref:Uncharacterized protein n=1 Tax=Trichoderma longibrachiatum ATCC 18648 TaxID=983965 RepID=A0A2T4BUP5_TRILO|nr:hypothetical protein M440DRAFT_1070410 [Trichoderma longibrachiatum ATCC 18648]
MALSKAMFFGVAERLLPFAPTVDTSIIVLECLDRALDGCSPGIAWHLSPWSPFAPRISRSALGNEGNRADNTCPFPGSLAHQRQLTDSKENFRKWNGRRRGTRDPSLACGAAVGPRAWSVISELLHRAALVADHCPLVAASASLSCCFLCG